MICDRCKAKKDCKMEEDCRNFEEQARKGPIFGQTMTCIEFDEDKGEISDGYHTFNELYFHRMVMFSIIVNANLEQAWKSWHHADGSMYEDMFIVGVTTDAGDYSYHFEKEFWPYFICKSLKTAPEWDGHKPEDIYRLLHLPMAEGGRNTCWHCGAQNGLIWGGDFSFDDYGKDGDGIVSNLTCHNCGAYVEYSVDLGNEEENN